MKIVLLTLAAAIAAPCADPGDLFSTGLGPVTIAPVHHASMVIQGTGRVIYVDPTGAGNYKGRAKADLVLVTAADADHFDPAFLARAAKNAAIVGPVEIGAGLKRFTPLENGKTIQFGDITIEAVPAYSPSKADAKPGQQQARGNGYVLTYPGLRIYVSGSTALIPEMKAIKNIDVAFLAVGSPGALSPEDAVQAILQIKPKTVYPYQYGQTSLDDIRKQLLHAVPGVEVRVRNWYE